MIRFSLTFLALVFLFQSNVSAAQKIKETNYFASLRSSKTNVRSGPGKNYPIKFTYKVKSIPVRIINEYDNWSEIEDYDKQTGWISQSLLTKRRTLMVHISKEFTTMHSKNNGKSRVIYRLENNVIGEYLKCVGNWCGIKIKKKKGWVLRDDLFGVSKVSKEKSLLK